MQFEYELSVDDYVAAQHLFWKLKYDRKRISNGIGYILIGAFFIVIAWGLHVIDWAPVLLVTSAALWFYSGMKCLFPWWFFRRTYRELPLAGKKFQADVDEKGLDVAGDLRSWRVLWAGVQLMGENEKVFIFTPGVGDVIFIFGKKYLTGEQQHALRSLAGMTAQ